MPTSLHTLCVDMCVPPCTDGLDLADKVFTYIHDMLSTYLRDMLSTNRHVVCL